MINFIISIYIEQSRRTMMKIKYKIFNFIKKNFSTSAAQRLSESELKAFFT